jgi:hypothetical protein
MSHGPESPSIIQAFCAYVDPIIRAVIFTVGIANCTAFFPTNDESNKPFGPTFPTTNQATMG